MYVFQLRLSWIWLHVLHFFCQVKAMPVLFFRWLTSTETYVYLFRGHFLSSCVSVVVIVSYAQLISNHWINQSNFHRYTILWFIRVISGLPVIQQGLDLFFVNVLSMQYLFIHFVFVTLGELKCQKYHKSVWN